MPPHSQKRFVKPPYQGQKGKCAWCGTGDLPPGRRSWCSQECVDAYLMVSSSDFIRKKVFERDKGMCAICGIDSNAAYRQWCEARKEAARLADRLIHMWKCAPGTTNWTEKNFAEQRKYKEDIVKKHSPGNWTSGRNNGWDADHIIPVAEGGGECDLANYRTLCHPCHKTVTAALAARLAASRRVTKRQKIGDLFPTA